MINGFTQQLQQLTAMSNQYGADPTYVLAGGGNTSFKSDTHLWVKGSGTSLATIRAEDFVVLERQKLAKMWDVAYPADETAREAAVLKDMMAARIPGENRRPSVETLLHDLFPQKFVLHVHPALVNGLTCAAAGKAAMERLFPDALWVEACKPGYVLALECKQVMEAYTARTGKVCQVLFLQNHGIFFAADTTREADELAHSTMEVLRSVICREPALEEVSFDPKKAAAIGAVLQALYGGEQPAAVEFTARREIRQYDPAMKGLSPDHIVYCKAKQLILPADADEDKIKALFGAFVAENGYQPKIAFAEGLGMFACGLTEKEALTAQSVMLDAIQVVAYAESFGGVSPMPDWLIAFIVNWEVESYRSKVSLSAKAQ